MTDTLYKWHADDWEMYAALLHWPGGPQNVKTFVAFSNGLSFPEYTVALQVVMDAERRIAYLVAGHASYSDYIAYGYHGPPVERSGGMDVVRSLRKRAGDRVEGLLHSILGGEWRFAKHGYHWHQQRCTDRIRRRVSQLDQKLPPDLVQVIQDTLTPAWLVDVASANQDHLQRACESVKEFVFSEASRGIRWSTPHPVDIPF